MQASILQRVANTARNPRPHPITPLGGPFRRWHLTPWKRTEATALLDDLNGSNLGDDSETGWMDLANTFLGQAGNIYGASKGLVAPRPMPGQYYPAGTTVSPLSTMSTQTMLLLGAAALGAVLILKKK